MHKFYHADRNASLIEGQDILLDQNQLSRFGATYWPAISSKNPADMTDAEKREFHLEEVRREKTFSNYTSRLQSMFAANSIHEAIMFAKAITPIPDNPVPIIEIYAEKFWTLDMNWMDYKCSHEQTIKYYRKYWYSEITNHCPKEGVRRPPRLEVLIALPAKAGKTVDTVTYP